MTLFAGFVVIAAAVWAIVRRVDVRLALLLAALALGVLAGRPELIVQKFLTTLVSERFVIPIACSLGFDPSVRRFALYSAGSAAPFPRRLNSGGISTWCSLARRSPWRA